MGLSSPKYLRATSCVITIEEGSFSAVLRSPLRSGKVNIARKAGSANTTSSS